MPKPIRHTRRDPGNAYTLAALASFTAAHATRESYDRTLQAAIAAYGDLPPGKGAISGIYADHFPDPVKAQLRTYARIIGEHTEQAYQLWRKAGRRTETIRPWQADARVLADGRISYY